MTAPATRTVRRRPLFVALTASLLFSASLLGDRALGLFGFPAEAPDLLYPVAPPFYESRVQAEEFSYWIRTNSRGIRSPEIPLAKSPGTRRLILLGDSFVEGAGVSDDQRWSDLLAARLGRRSGCSVEIVNCGQGGTGPAAHLRTLLDACAAYQPDAVLIGVFPNDVSDTAPDTDVEMILEGGVRRRGLRRILHSLWPHVYILVRDRSAPKTPEDPDALADWLAELAAERGASEERIRIWRNNVPRERLEAVAAGRTYLSTVSAPLMRPRRWRDLLDLESNDAAARFQKIEEILSRITGTVRDIGAAPGLLYFPDRLQYDPQSHQNWRAETFKKLGVPHRTAWLSQTSALEQGLERWAKADGTPFFNSTKRLRSIQAEVGDPLTYPIDGHWTPRGHSFAAEMIEEALLHGPLSSLTEDWGCGAAR